MRILQVCGGPSWGGIEIQTVFVSSELIKAGNELHVFCSKKGQVQKHALELNIPCSSALFDPETSWLSSYKACKKLLRTFKPDIIHVQRSHDLSVVVAALRFLRLKTKLVFTRRMESRVNKKTIIHRWIYSSINRTWCVSSFVRANFLKTSPAKADRVFVMNNGINLEKFNPQRHVYSEVCLKYSLPNDKILIGMSGRVSSMKGHLEFIRAAALLIEQSQKPLFFIMAGGASVGEEDYAKSIYNMAEEILPENSYIFLDFQSDLSEILSVLDIYVFPSHRESFGNVLLEAMAMQKAIVAVYAGGVSDIVECNKTAVCVSPKSSKEIFEAVQLFLNDKDKCRQFALEAKKRAENFSWTAFLLNLQDEYQTLINESDNNRQS